MEPVAGQQRHVSPVAATSRRLGAHHPLNRRLVLAPDMALTAGSNGASLRNGNSPSPILLIFRSLVLTLFDPAKLLNKYKFPHSKTTSADHQLSSVIS